MEAESSCLSRARGALLSRMLRFLWDVYSKPHPSRLVELLPLVVLCLLVSVAIAGLLYVWMVFSLTYDPHVVAILSCTCGCMLTALLALVHPLRCVVTVTVPSLGTKQGRKVLLSTALVLALSLSVPNMTLNIGRTVAMVMCSSQAAAESTLRSSRQVSRALHDIREYLDEDGSSRLLTLQQDVNISQMTSDLTDMSGRVKAELTSVHRSLDQASVTVKKLIGSLFVLLMLGSSAAYVIGYLTDVKYDNVYLTKRLREALRASGNASVPECRRRKLLKTSGVKMSGKEVRRAAWGVVVLLFYSLLCAVVMAMDQFIFSTLQALLAWTSDVPEVTNIITVEMSVSSTLIGFIPLGGKSLSKEYSYIISVLPAHCMQHLSPPATSSLTSVYVLLSTSLLMLLGEVFARRLRRKICASFYRQREEERTRHLLQKILDQREDSGE